MMKPADARERRYLAGLDRLYRFGISGSLFDDKCVRQVCE
jgi:hypothetical protein